MEITNDGSDTPDEVNNANETPLSLSDPLPYPPKPSLSKLSFHTSLETMPKRERFLKEQRKSETHFNKQQSVVIVENEDLIRRSISSPSPLVANPAHDGKPEVEDTATTRQYVHLPSITHTQSVRTDSPLQKLGKFFRKRGTFSEVDTSGVSMQSLDQYVQHREHRKMTKSKEQLHMNVNNPTPQTQTLIELVRSKWEKSADKLPIHSDLPRLLKHIELLNSEGEKIMNKHDSKKPYVVSKKILRNFLETLAIELGDTRDILPNVIQHFGHSSPYDEDDEDADLSVEVRLFIKSYMKEDSPTLRVLKAITQTIIAAPFVELKQQFAEIHCDFVDVSGTWGIKVNIGPGDGSVSDKVVIIHTKGGRSATDQGFEFVWELALQFDRHMKNLEGISLTIPEITFASDYPRDKKKEIQKIIARWSGNTRRSTIRRSRASLEPSPRIETESEKNTVKELLGSNATLQHMQWGTVTQNNKTKDRLFVLSNYRVLLINKSQMFGQKKKIYEGHLFNLLALSILDADKIKMKFIDSTFEFASTGIAAAVDIIINSYRKIQYCLPIIRPPIEISPLRHPNDAMISKRGIITIEEAGNRVIDAYVAYCEYYKTPIRKPIIAYLTSLISSGDRHLRLDAIPDSDPLDLEPLAAALKYDTFFDSLTLSNIPRKEAIVKLSLTVEYSKTLTHLVLSGLDTEDGFSELGNAIKRNVACRLVSIDLSYNTIRDKSMSELAQGIASLKFLRILKLAHCNIGANGMVDLMKEIGTNKLLYETLEELDISGNPFGTIGSAAVSSWISSHNKSLQMLKTVRLVTLNLSNCQSDLYSIFENLRKSPFRYSIEQLDISNNKLDAITFEAICKFNNSSVSLKYLGMSSCGVTSKQAKLILQSISNNHLLHSVTIDLSHNSLGTDVGGPISACLLISKNISGLILRSNDIKKEGLTQLIHAAAINGCVQLLDISHNKCGVNSKVIQALSDLLAESKLETLNIAGLSLGPELGTIFPALVNNTTLKFLDITKNHCGDSSAHILSEALKVNKALTTLKWDSNNITLEGWKSFKDCMKYNKTLCSSPLPQKDIRASVSLIYSRDRNLIQNSIATLMSEIQQSLKLNQLGHSPYRSVGVTRSYSNICTSSYRLNVQDVCWFSVWDDCNGNLLPYLESSFRVKNAEDVENGKALVATHEQVKSVLGDVTGISVAVVALHRNKGGNRVINVAIAGPVRVMLWGVEGVFMDIDGKESTLGKEKLASVEVNGGCSHVIMGSKVFWESIDDESVLEVMKTMHHSSEQASNKLHKTVLERGVKEHFTVSVIAV